MIQTGYLVRPVELLLRLVLNCEVEMLTPLEINRNKTNLRPANAGLSLTGLTHQQKEAVVEMVKQQIAGADMASFVIVTDSMRPIIKPGNTVVVKDWPAEKLIRGDIILYEEQHILYAHRLLYKTAKPQKYRKDAKEVMLVTKGDHSRTIDPPFPEEHLLGKVVTIEKKGRRIDLGVGPWRAFNWILAILSLIEALLFRIARKVIK